MTKYYPNKFKWFKITENTHIVTYRLFQLFIKQWKRRERRGDSVRRWGRF